MPSNNSYQPLTSQGPYYPQQQATASNTLKPLSVDEICAEGAPLPPLQLGEKIVWLSDTTGPEFGMLTFKNNQKLIN